MRLPVVREIELAKIGDHGAEGEHHGEDDADGGDGDRVLRHVHGQERAQPPHRYVQAEIDEDEPEKHRRSASVGEEAFPAHPHGAVGPLLQLSRGQEEKEAPGHEGGGYREKGHRAQAPCGNEEGEHGRTSRKSQVAPRAEYPPFLSRGGSRSVWV